MDHKFYKHCIVPQCKSTTILTPKKLFVHVPRREQMRKKWLQLARRDVNLASDSQMYFCEDHFDLPNDMENYMKYHMGFVSQIRMKRNTLPSKFDCQPDRRAVSSLMMDGGQRPMIIKECLNESVESSIGIGSTSAVQGDTSITRPELELGLHSELDIKFEPEELKQEQEDCDIDCHSDYDIGSTPTIKTGIGAANGSTEQAALDLITAGTDSQTNTGSSSSNTHSAERIYYICNTCPYKTTIKINSIHHSSIYNHKMKKTHFSTVCDKKFANKQCFDDCGKPNACNICDKQFKNKSCLNRHMKTHTGENPYVCNICDKKFNQKHNLNRHIRTHTGEKPYDCKICDKKFKQNSDLKRHIRTHIGEKPYACKICDKKLANKRCFNKHVITHTK